MICNDLTDYLSTNGVGTEGTDLFRGPLLPHPDAGVWLLQVGGFPSIHAMNSSPGQGISRPSVQVVVRARTYDAAATKANDCFKLLDGLRQTTINSTRYLWIAAALEPFFIERDDDEREIFAFNVNVMKDISA